LKTEQLKAEIAVCLIRLSGLLSFADDVTKIHVATIEVIFFSHRLLQQPEMEKRVSNEVVYKLNSAKP